MMAWNRLGLNSWFSPSFHFMSATSADFHMEPQNEFSPLQRLIRNRRSIRKYADRLHALTAPKTGLYQNLDDETIICRCEGVTVGKIKAFLAKTGGSLTELKPSRISMGPCQGRVCEPIILELLSLWGHSPGESGELHLRPPITPVPLGVFEKEAVQYYICKMETSNPSTIKKKIYHNR